MTDEEKTQELLQERLDTVAEFYEALYHDLKTPMTILFNNVMAMEKIEELPKVAVTYLEEIKRSSFRMAKLVRDANDRVRLNQGLLMPRYVMADGVALIKNICDSAHVLMLNKNIRIIFSSPVSSFGMAMDQQMWERIVLNLLANAKDYSFWGDEIHCSIDIKDDVFSVTIRDFGKGVPPELASSIFARYTGDTGRGLRSGLGLYIVKELSTLMGGEVQIKSADPGTEVTINVPVFYTEEQQEIMIIDDFFSDNMVQMELSSI